MFSNEKVEKMEDRECEVLTPKSENPQVQKIALKARYAFDENGFYYCDGDTSRHDLFMAPRKLTVWVNVYPPGTNCFAWAYETEAIANNYAGRNRIGNRAWPLEIED